MSYSPVYTTIEKVSSLIQVDLDTTSVPKIDEVLVYIQESEAKVIDRGLGSHNATNAYIDVPVTGSSQSSYTFDLTDDVVLAERTGLVIPLGMIKHPIISVSNLAKNEASIGAAPVWEALTQWSDSAASDFMLLKSGRRDAGYALYIYENIPSIQGPNRLKMTYLYGSNVPTAILSDYCTLDVAIRVLMVRMGTNEIDGLSRVYGNNVGSAMVTNYTERIAEMKEKMALIEIMHFPGRSGESNLNVAII